MQVQKRSSDIPISDWSEIIHSGDAILVYLQINKIKEHRRILDLVRIISCTGFKELLRADAEATFMRAKILVKRQELC